MANHIFSVAAFCVVLVLMADAATRSFNKTILSANQCAFQQPRCGFCRQPITVTITATNNLVEPKFEQNVTIKYSQRPLLHFLQKAADTNGAFNFSASYHGNLGFMVNTINKVTANVAAKTYWQIKSVTNGYNSLLCGVSTYIPKRNEYMLINGHLTSAVTECGNEGQFNSHYDRAWFESTYYPTLGHFIDSINGVRGFRENKTFWHIISVDGVGSLECGASSYIPVNGDNILFNFTTWAAAGFDY